MKSYILFLYFFIQTFTLLGQNNRTIDSLKLVLKNISQSSLKFDILTKVYESYLFTNLDSANIYKGKILFLGEKNPEFVITSYSLASKYHYYKYEIDSALFYAQKALELSLKSNDYNLEADSYRKIAILYSRKSDYANAKKYGVLALKSAQSSKNWNLIASAFTMLGNQSFKKNNYATALEYYLSADSIYSANNENGRFLALVSDNIGNIYSELKDSKALGYIQKSEKIYRRLNDNEGLNYNHTLKAIYYQRIGEHQKAIDNFGKSQKFYEEYGNIYRKNEIYTRLIKSYSAIGNFEQAEIFLKKSELLNLEDATNEILLEFNLNAGQLYLDKKKYKKAILYFEKASTLISEISSEFELSWIKNINYGLAQSYFGIKDFKSAYSHKQKQLSISDSIYKKNSIDITNDLESKYQTQKKEQEIQLLKSERALAEQQTKNQRNLLLGGIGITSLALIFLFTLYRNRQKTTNKLREIDSLKTTFFTNISHEFRTPLTLVSTPIQELLEDATLSKEKRAHFKMAERSVMRLSSLVDQLLELSKIDSGNRRLLLEQNTPTQMIAAWSESFLYLAQQKNIDFKIEISDKEIEAWFDREALENIIVNLLGNAVKYTPKQGEIHINVSIENDYLKIKVKNTGQGLTNSQIKTIFNRFYQTDGQNEGAGVGLSLVKELTELHNGKINVLSEVNKWTLFEVSLAIEKSLLKNIEIKVTTDSLPTGSTVNLELNEPEIGKSPENKELPILLIVEDNADVRRLLTDTFKLEYKVIEAVNGEEGCLKALNIIPDIIISDIMMPVKDGITLTNTLKNNELTSHIPIILLTAKAGDKNKIAGIEIGADDYITKPFNQKILKSKTASLIALRRKLQSRYSQEVILKPKDIAITSVDEKFLERVQHILDEKLVEPSFSSEQFSKAIHMSRMQLHRKLKALTGLSASEFIRSQRLKLAIQILKQSDINVSEVGYSVGFNNHAYFSKCFKEAYNCTPTDFGSPA
ncbi:ATP-binding protein [Maribacter antarcticus]|uniref:ATP-binding protein n=1 Tax=Maribacter antarcticus TaxID=505250 RepID=UPI00047903CD|nr:ATP-binding protein [Maribacter antarcticus]